MDLQIHKPFRNAGFMYSALWNFFELKMFHPALKNAAGEV
jgi:hypothetical protein